MIEAPTPKDEAERLKSLRALGLLDTPPQEAYDRITRIATRLLGTPMSTLTLIDSDREWFLSLQGIAERQGPRSRSFCGHALLADDVMVVPDALKDPRFDGNSLVVGPPYVRFYMGKTLYSLDGQRIGVFCVKDVKPRVPSDDEIQDLRDLAAWAELEVNARDLRHRLDDLQPILQEHFMEGKSAS
jgi:GAF domain-containing protein